MILYTNGTGHTAAANAVNSFSKANEDRTYWNLENRPHPANIKVSWGYLLADWLKMGFHTEAQVDQSNIEVISNTLTWLNGKKPNDVFVIVQWGKFENLDQDWKSIKAFYLHLIEMEYTNFLFFNGDESFIDIPAEERYNFSEKYIDPYFPEGTYDGWLRGQGFDTVITSNYYFGPSAHAAWARHLLNHIIQNKLV